MLSDHRPIRIGLTGGIGSGKSIACQYFESLGVPVCDADEIAHQLTQPDHPVIKQIVSLFGKQIIDCNGALIRSRIRELAFSQPQLLVQLEELLHPLIREKIDAWVREQHHHYIILSIPLLFEKGWQHQLDRTLVIDTSPEIQMIRAIQRDHATKQTIQAIIDKQIDRETRLTLADDIVENSGTINSLQQQLLKLHQFYICLKNVKN